MVRPEQINNCYLAIEEDSLFRAQAQGAPIDTLIFTNMPENLGATKSANVASTAILGRSEPIRTFGSSSARAWNLNLDFFCNEDAQRDVVDKINFCESLAYPIFREGISQGLPTILFKFGNYLNVRTICTSVTPNIPGPWEVIDNNANIGLPYYSSVSLTLEQINSSPPGHYDVRFGRHNRLG